MDFVKVIFQHNGEFSDDTYRKYLYKNNIEDLELEDLVVVDTINGYQVAKVVEFTGDDEGRELRYLVQKIDLDFFEKSKTSEERRKKLEKEINAHIAKKKRMQELEELASGDVKLQEMVKELKELS